MTSATKNVAMNRRVTGDLEDVWEEVGFSQLGAVAEFTWIYWRRPRNIPAEFETNVSKMHV